MRRVEMPFMLVATHVLRQKFVVGLLESVAENSRVGVLGLKARGFQAVGFPWTLSAN